MSVSNSQMREVKRSPSWVHTWSGTCVNSQECACHTSGITLIGELSSPGCDNSWRKLSWRTHSQSLVSLFHEIKSQVKFFSAPVSLIMADSTPIFSNIHHFLPSKLSSTNYLLWNSQFSPLLKCHNLMGTVYRWCHSVPFTFCYTQDFWFLRLWANHN